MIDDLTPPQAAARLGHPDCDFLDCREAFELQRASLPGAIHIPMGQIPGRLGELDPKREIIVFCHHGIRSLSVAAFLMENGFERVKNLAGGIDGWSLTVDPEMPRY